MTTNRVVLVLAGVLAAAVAWHWTPSTAAQGGRVIEGLDDITDVLRKVDQIDVRFRTVQPDQRETTQTIRGAFVAITDGWLMLRVHQSNELRLISRSAVIAVAPMERSDAGGRQ